MNRRLSALSLAAIVCACFGNSPAKGQADQSNEYCPVMPGRKALSGYRSSFRGREIRFCCSSCVRKFQENASAYVKNLPVIGDDADDGGWLTRSRFDRIALRAKDVTDRFRVELVCFLFVAALMLAGARARRKQPPHGRISRFLTWSSAPSSLAVLSLAGLSISIALRWREAEAATERLRVEHEHALASAPDWNKAAELTRWAWPQGFHRLPQGMHPTYYRGNDERSEKLFNGGRYRTATFRLSVMDAEGKPANPGTPVRGLKLRFDILRAPKTSEHFFSPDVMSGIFLANAQDGAQKIPFRSVQANQAWAAEIDLGTSEGAGYASIRRLWLLSVGSAEKLRLPDATVHYAIHIHLHAKDGRLLPQSSVWMVPVYASPILNDVNADAEWFSDDPIPENEGEPTDDPELLGLTPKKSGQRTAK